MYKRKNATQMPLNQVAVVVECMQFSLLKLPKQIFWCDFAKHLQLGVIKLSHFMTQIFEFAEQYIPCARVSFYVPPYALIAM